MCIPEEDAQPTFLFCLEEMYTKCRHQIYYSNETDTEIPNTLHIQVSTVLHLNPVCHHWYLVLCIHVLNLCRQTTFMAFTPEDSHFLEARL